MQVLKVLTWPDKILETKAEPITVFDEELQALSDSMHLTMREENGIGLAANQVGILKQILVIEIPWLGKRYKQDTDKKHWHDKRFTLVNPEIVAREDTITFEEGCLSFPELFGEVERARRILVKAQDTTGKQLQIEADDLFSICLQHEIDHLHGIVFIKHMSNARSQAIKQKMLARKNN